MAEQPNSTSANISSLATSFAERLKPLSASLGKNITQLSQLARERISANADVTELPQEYRDLEDRVDRIKTFHENFIRVGRNYTLPHYDYEAPLSETLGSFASKAGDRASGLAASGARAVGVAGAETIAPPKPAREEAPSGLSHAFSRAATQAALSLGTQEPLGAALQRFAATHDKIANARLKQDHEAVAKFYQPFSTTLNQTIAHAMKARNNVKAVRLNYDAARAKLKAARPEKVEPARVEMEAAEDEFVTAVDDAMGKMKLVVESTEPLKNLTDLVAIQLAYFKEAHEALAELAPEIEELQVTNEALLRNPAE
ncbi:uncharacterized protein BJ171DRAFT_485969 [Polychytrium aggregatum]|uniref:uncharacterized protein n=1 Tax=Polychytrium aggregatum TaxID=110093 RepID=UPI0022FF3567|nr:uncharacterized protein BJ171DRAFT_485969 [Polychytrium aggregatum]KAI9209263.1 hypothetical protein BJ171DRAFT_485969 [Polychytrium aggregatum]